MEKSVVRNEKY